MKFAHMADIHLGYQKDPILQDMERRTFEDVVGECVSRKVDFVIMAGDIFHVNVPGMDVQKHAFSQFKRLHDANIPVYAVYGSHDHSPLSNSVIDLLAEIGYITKMEHERLDDKIRLSYVRDPGSGALLAGLSGLKAGKDVENYGMLERQEPPDGSPKIFIFHGALKDMGDGERGEQMAASLMPRGFDYYAGGHLHVHSKEENLGGLPVVVYSGTPFAGNWRDMVKNSDAGEDGVSRTKRGIVIVEYDGKISTEFVPMSRARYKRIRVDANNKNSETAASDLVKKVTAANAEGRIVVVNAEGALSSGKTSDIDLSGARSELKNSGASAVLIRNAVTSKEYDVRAEGSGKDECERRTFEANIENTSVRRPELVGERGIKTAMDLLKCMRVQKEDDVKNADYEERVRGEAFAVLGLDDDT